MLDLKELLISLDRHLITCLIANQMQGNDTLHPGNVLSSFLQHLAQEILLIIAPPGTDDAPLFLHHPEIYGIEFWHDHLNYACTRLPSLTVLILFKGMCSAWTIPSRNCRKSTSSTSFRGRWQREFKSPSDVIFAGSGLCISKEGNGVRSKTSFSSVTASICDLFCLVFNNG